MKPVDFDTGLSTWTVAKKLFLEFPVEPLNIFTTDSGGLTAPGGTQTLYFSEEDVRSAGSLSISTTHPSFGEQVAFVAMNEIIKEYLDLDPKLGELIIGARCGVSLGEKYSLEQIGYSSIKCAGEIASAMADSMKENAISRLQSEAAEKALKSKVFFLNALRIATGFGAQLTADALAGLTTTRLTIPIKYKDDPEPSHVKFTQDGFMSIRLGDPEQKVKRILTFERFEPGAGANACSLYKSSAHPYTHVVVKNGRVATFVVWNSSQSISIDGVTVLPNVHQMKDLSERFGADRVRKERSGNGRFYVVTAKNGNLIGFYGREPNDYVNGFRIGASVENALYEICSSI
ncbi:MAG: hypothetical protein Q4A31_12360 [Corynebacterium sp.]|nr:hypothetical protein [Corynebacterium sp.]MDO4762705.1 hypothetical protein [Corynebacterium sp.]